MPASPSPGRLRIVVAGASGFVGKALVGKLVAEGHEVIGLSRRSRAAGPGGIAYRACDLFSLRDADEALAGADIAFYLVHSMMPSARLTQGRFEDFDLICADNFARAARRNQVKQLVYLGGILPGERDALSPHLQSRLEVERTLAGQGVPLTTLRAGLILGAGGSSFEIMRRLIERLPAMILPRWTATRAQPVALADVVHLLAFVVGREATHGRSFDVAAPEVTTYRELMAMLAEELRLRHRPSLPVPLLTPKLSRLWVTLITGAPKELVAPLIGSLEHEMLARNDDLAQMAGLRPMSLQEALRTALRDDANEPASERATAPHAFVAPDPALRSGRLVRSVQRMTLPNGRDAAWAAHTYMRWLPRALRSIVFVDVDGNGRCVFYLGPRRYGLQLLVLDYAPERSGPDRQLLYVTGGILFTPAGPGVRPARFELRQILDGRTLITAIHDFHPRLPWLIYAATQALFHAWVMSRFRRHLARSPGSLPSVC